MFDTHCHLNFKAFRKTVEEVIAEAHAGGVTDIMMPGTDVKTSERAVELSQTSKHLYAAVGIHPHHVFQYLNPNIQQQPNPPAIDSDLQAIEQLLANERVLAVGEVGMDKHVYEETKYAEYAIDERFMQLQTQLFERQVELAISHSKSLILHNREAKKELLPILETLWDKKLEYHTVFHCCEPDEELLQFARDHHMYIGVDGDITYGGEKQEFIKNLQLEMLVLETDAPFLLPEPLRSEKRYPNKPGNVRLIAETVATLKKQSIVDIIEVTKANSMRLFGLSTLP